VILLAIDPGTTESAWVRYDTIARSPLVWAKEPNADVLKQLHSDPAPGRLGDPHHVVIEMLQSYGMPAGREMFETAVWIGRFMEAWLNGTDVQTISRMYRPTVKGHICGDAKAKDANVRQALLDRYGGKEAAIGNKAKRGPLWGMKADVWAALALAITWSETHQ
jgi:hypothetical protein